MKRYAGEKSIKKLMQLVLETLPSAEIGESEVQTMWENTTAEEAALS